MVTHYADLTGDAALTTDRGVAAFLRELAIWRTVVVEGAEGEPIHKREYMASRSDWRRARTFADPLAFAVLYLGHHLKGEATAGRLSLSEAHLEWCDRASVWAEGPPIGIGTDRHADIAPRETGKSTWWFLAIPLWAAAHGHVRFAAAFADSASQAEGHLETFKKELGNNARIRADYPELVEPMQKVGRRSALVDNRHMIQSASGFVFSAKGIEASALGLKVGERRPDLLLLDDIEPGEEKYSLAQVETRLSTIQDVIFPLSDVARVEIVGTVTMPGSIIHQLVKSAKGIAPDAGASTWITDEKIKAHHHNAIIADDAGRERSIWPSRWSMDHLNSIRHTRSFAKNYANDPRGNDGGYWTSEDFTIGDVPGIARVLLEIDPAVTSKSTSDFTGLAVIGYSPASRTCLVKAAIAVKLTPARLRERILDLLDEFPEIGMIRIEVNQGGDLWPAILHDMPVPIKVITNSIPKEVRAAEVLNLYQRSPSRIVHVPGLDALEQQMTSFPKAPNDDLVDAVGDGCMYFLRPRKKARTAKGRPVRYAR